MGIMFNQLKTTRDAKKRQKEILAKVQDAIDQTSDLWQKLGLTVYDCIDVAHNMSNRVNIMVNTVLKNQGEKINELDRIAKENAKEQLQDAEK